MNIPASHWSIRVFATSIKLRLLLLVMLALAATVAVSAPAGGLRGYFGPAESAADVEGNLSARAHVFAPTVVPASTGPLIHARRGHTATLLTNGKVLVVGGENMAGFATVAEIFDPATGSFSVSGNLNTPRADHTATRLNDGRVLIAGGRGDLGPLTSSEIFDPATGLFIAGPNLSGARSGHTATVLGDGRIFVAGGDIGGTGEFYDPSTDSFSSAGGSLVIARFMHSAALVVDDRVVIVGGKDVGGNPLTTVEVYDLTNNNTSLARGELNVARVRAHLHVLFDGKVQIIGGADDGSMEIYDSQNDIVGAYAHVQPEGDTCAGLSGQVQAAQTRAALFHNGQTNETFDRNGHTMSELAAQAIVIGGVNSSAAVLDSAPLFASSDAQISTDKLDYSPGQTVYISGRGFQPLEIVRIKVHEDPHTPLERGMDITADANGDFIGEYLVQNYDLNVKFFVGARGLLSGRTAQTTFTDAIRTWTGALSTDWSTAGNWSGGVPTAADDAIIQLPLPSGRFPVIDAGDAATLRDITIGSGATVTQTGGTLTVARDFANAGSYLATGGTVTFTGTAQNNTSPFPVAGTHQFFNVVITSGVNPRFNQNGATIYVLGDWTNNGGTSSVATGLFAGGTQSIGGTAASTFTTLTVMNGSTTTAGALNPAITNFNVNNGGKYIHNIVGALPGTTRTFGTTSTIEYQRNTPTACPVQAAYGTLIINVNNFSSSIGCGGNLASVAGNLEVRNTNGQELRLVSSTATTHNIGGDLSITGGATSLVISNGTASPIINVGGNLNVQMGVLNLGSAVNSPALNVNGSFSQTNGQISKSSGGTATLNLKGNWTRTGGVFIANGIAVALTGTTSQSVNSSVAQSFSNLTINNAAGVVLSGTYSMTGALTLTDGVVDTASNLAQFTLFAGVTITGASSSSYINGKLNRIYGGTGFKTFPVGKGGFYRPVTINLTSVSGTPTVSVEQFESGFPGTAPSGISQLGTRYWNVTQTGGSSFTYDITLDGTGVTSAGPVKILKYDGSNTVSLNTTAPNYTASGLTSLSELTFAEAFPGSLQLSSATYSNGESNADYTFNIPVTRTGGSGGAVSISYSVADGTATTADNDYAISPTSGTLNWADGETAAKNIAITVKGDTKFESDETITVSISAPGGGATLGSPTAVLTITNDDTAPTFSLDDVTHSEGHSGTTVYVFTVTKNGSTALNATVDYQTQDGTATTADGDYTGIPTTTLTFLPADTAKTIAVNVNGETHLEPDENFFVNLSNPTSSTISDNQGQGTIQNDDPIATDDSATLAEDSGANAIDVLANDTAAPGTGDTLTVTAASDPANGSTSFTATGISYTPDSNFFGTDTFTYTISDGNGGSDTATVIVTVTSVTDAPQGTDTVVTTNEDTDYTFASVDFGFSDPNDSPANHFLSVKITTLPAAGTLTNNGSPVTASAYVTKADIDAGKLKFTPAPNANGTPYTTFTFQVKDDGASGGSHQHLDQSPNTMAINATPVNDAPTLTLQDINVDGVPQVTMPAVINQGQTLTFKAVGNDIDVPAQTITYSLALGTTPVPVGATINPTTGDSTWTASALNVGTYNFKVVITDNDSPGLSAEQALIISVNYNFQGFFSPVDNLPIVNTVKAGSAVPVKWRLTGAGGAPVTNPNNFAGLFSYQVNCGTTDGLEDAVETVAPGGSGLQYQGDGNWQINWKTLPNYAKGSCRVMELRLNDGRSHYANFKFK